ncbi:hypothetical protein CQW23_24892 [Capsicum baccatum]|uniref:Zinc finger PMZ-type domain-containing protein n=1 Tax=Capsicum baccatum TaxID=33114 RepID=A0A2G2VW53_CAPBA|nr:hypothetical protein CQW23_24892 [Capsicum baccatum]
MQSGDLDCAPSDVVISYVMHSREKVNPTIINSDVCVLTYIMDADAGNPNGVLDEYTVFGNGVTAKVNLLERSCSCRKFDLVKMPCELTMAALREKYDDDEDYGKSIYDYSSPIYKAESYLLVYSEAINVVPSEAEWTVP